MTGAGIIGVGLLFLGATTGFSQVGSRADTARVLVFGDVNLGRAVGQRILQGDIGYPFALVAETLRTADIVFVNLESQLSNQNGVTQHPKYNMIFTGPPAGAASLRQANITIVSTANNHAFDYGSRALEETLGNLSDAGVRAVGTSVDSGVCSRPVIAVHGGVKIGFLAYTQFVNGPAGWSGRIALFEISRVQKEIRALRPQVDFLVVSYHAGTEYVDAPSKKLQSEFHALIDAGADVVLGHHPHYVQGIERYAGKLIFMSLGNFVFYQPQREWARYGLGALLNVVKDSGGTRIEEVQLHAVYAGLQPTLSLPESVGRQFFVRLGALSNVSLVRRREQWFID